MIPRVAAIVNPAAGGGAISLAGRIEMQLPGLAVRVTRGAGHATELTRELLRAGYDCILAIGGDGTVNEIVNGFFDGGSPIDSGAAVAVLPLGTGGDFRRSLGIRSLEDAVQAVRRWHPRLIDIGRLTYLDPRGIQRNRYFANVVSFGMGGEVAVRAKGRFRALGGKAAFFLAALGALTSYRAKSVEIELDGVAVGTHTILNIAIGNGRYHGGGMHVCPNAVLDDGRLDVTVIDSLSLFELIRDRAALYSDNIYLHPKTRGHRAAQVRARSHERVAVEADGEPLGFLPLQAEVIPRAIRVLSA
jgi:diacylglycerol kinase (ATP)